MVIEEIRELINEAKYKHIGVRADNRDYQVGEIMDNSHQLFEDPQYNDAYTELLYLIFPKGLMLDSTMPASLTEYVHLNCLKITLKKCLKK